jgi:hypothetical protein
MPIIPALGRMRQDDLEFEAAWAMEQIQGCTGLYNKTLSQKNNK